MGSRPKLLPFHLHVHMHLISLDSFLWAPHPSPTLSSNNELSKGLCLTIITHLAHPLLNTKLVCCVKKKKSYWPIRFQTLQYIITLFFLRAREKRTWLSTYLFWRNVPLSVWIYKKNTFFLTSCFQVKEWNALYMNLFLWRLYWSHKHPPYFL